MDLRGLSAVSSNYCGTLPFIGGSRPEGDGTASAVRGMKNDSMKTALEANSAFVAAGLSAPPQQP